MRITWIHRICEFFDILAIQESKTDDTDDIQVPGYHVFYHNRAKGPRTVLMKDCP